ncbi:chorismate mutase 2, cytosolic-like isoform X1 [Zingiber officinale]|nr:chorismate mutase 2, cytosolic-like isoform X1 [Zingiber officinale]
MVSRPLFYTFSFLSFSCLCSCKQLQEMASQFNLESVREFLTREEDSIVFSLIERAKYPSNLPAYDPSYSTGGALRNYSLLDLFARETEAVQARAGRYRNPEEIPFFPKVLVLPLVPAVHSQVLHPASASVNASNAIWKMYFNRLPQFTAKGDDGRYALTAAADLVCLQALSRRINYGRFVAEAKFRDAPKDYTSAIRAEVDLSDSPFFSFPSYFLMFLQDRDALMRLLTSAAQEETVKSRVKKKAKVFGQDVTVNNISKNESSRPKYKVDPDVVVHLYGDWVIPLTKLVEVEYLLHRLD